MKLINASFENFRLLKDISIEFSVDSQKTLTVLRAANESGKTTMLTAMQWGLFGDEALPGGGRTYRMHPLDVSTTSGTRVDITVTIDYEVEGKTGPRRYRLIRSATEVVDGNEWNRNSTNLSLFHLTRTGAEPLENPEAHIKPHLPNNLREVFFTDGDRALNFIEGDAGQQKKLVEGAIRSLLGLDVIEKSIVHVDRMSRDLNKKIKQASGDKHDLTIITEKIDSIQEELPLLEEELKETKDKIVRLSDLEKEADSRLADALRKGNQEELANELEKTKKAWLQADRSAAQAARDHSNLFRSEFLARQLLAPTIVKAKKILDDLHDRGKIPNQTVPVLEERLNQPTCICGESLAESDPEAIRRRNNIKQLIEASRNSDSVQKKITELFYSSKGLLTPVSGDGWIGEFNDVFARRQQASMVLKELGERQRALEEKLASIPKTNIKQLRETRNTYRGQSRDAYRKEVTLQTKVQERKKSLAEFGELRQKLLRADEKGLQILSELDVASDLHGILEAALESMKTIELAKVSDEMNSMFLDMIGGNKEQREKAIIGEAKITPDFRIEVTGHNNRLLQPSQDLNGASRRALTVAFILALTMVSEVEAPNVIDTPLGMTSGFVKQAMLRIAADNSTQLILFLTHDEIKGCEGILDQKAGKVITLTNPTHYPTILVNDPKVDEICLLRCDCNHNQSCTICERKDNAAA